MNDLAADIADDDFDHVREVAAPKRGKKIAASKLLMTINQLTVMTSNGVDLSEAFETAADSAQDDLLAESLERIHEAINSGQSLSAAVAAEASLPIVMPAMLAAGEAAGNVPASLRRISEMLSAEIQLRSAVIGALIYPVILSTASIGVMAAMIFFVLPQFGSVFESMGREVPPLTEMLLQLGRMAKEYFVPTLVTLGATVVTAWLMRNHPAVTRTRDTFLMNGPIVRDAFRPLCIGRLFRLIGTMLAGGVPLLDSIRLAKASSQNSFVRQLLDEVEEDLLVGRQADVAMSNADFLPREAAQMVATGVRTGKLSDVLLDAGGFYEDEGGRRLKRLVHTLEPLIILIMGGLVATIVLAIMLPMLDITSVH